MERSFNFNGIHSAIIDGDVAGFHKLVNERADLEGLDEKGLTPLHVAAFHGKLQFLRELLSRGVYVDSRNEVNYTPLMAAATNLQLEAMRCLVNAGAKVQNVDQDGRNALICVVGGQSINQKLQAECVRELLNSGIDVNHGDNEGLTGLMWAAWFGCLDSIMVMLDAGANKIAKDNLGRMAKDLAIKNDHFEIANIL